MVERVGRDALRRGVDPVGALAAVVLELARRGAVAAEGELQCARRELTDRRRAEGHARDKVRAVRGSRFLATKYSLVLGDAAARHLAAQRRYTRALAAAESWSVELDQTMRTVGPLLAAAERDYLRRVRSADENARADRERAAALGP